MLGIVMANKNDILESLANPILESIATAALAKRKVTGV
jgi:hypothetical protein